MTRVISVVLFMLIFSVGPIAAQEVLEGTWKLVSRTRTNTTTGATTDSFGPNPLGYIMSGKAGRMMVPITRTTPPKPASTDQITGEQRSRMFSPIPACSGRYTFDGASIQHKFDAS